MRVVTKTNGAVGDDIKVIIDRILGLTPLTVDLTFQMILTNGDKPIERVKFGFFSDLHTGTSHLHAN